MNMAVKTAGLMQIMDPTGHTEIVWDADVAVEVEVARTAFEKLVKEGYQAFEVGTNGQRGERLRTFDASAEKILMVPQLRGG